MDRKCKACYKTCYECKGFTDKDCISCKPGLFKMTPICTTSCPEAYYGDTIKGICSSCSTGCKACWDGDIASCTSCIIGYYLYSNSCYTLCPVGYAGEDTTNTCTAKCPSSTYADLIIRLCKPCNSSCKTCSGPNVDNCKSCNLPKYLYANKCLDACPDGTYIDNVFR